MASAGGYYEINFSCFALRIFFLSCDDGRRTERSPNYSRFDSNSQVIPSWFSNLSRALLASSSWTRIKILMAFISSSDSVIFSTIPVPEIISFSFPADDSKLASGSIKLSVSPSSSSTRRAKIFMAFAASSGSIHLFTVSTKLLSPAVVTLESPWLSLSASRLPAGDDAR